MTSEERVLWERLRRNAIGVPVRRQHVLFGWVVDFYIDAARLAVEIDGPVHRAQVEDDAARDAALLEAGVATLRVSADAIREDPQAVVRAIATAVRSRPSPDPSPAAEAAGEGS